VGHHATAFSNVTLNLPDQRVELWYRRPMKKGNQRERKNRDAWHVSPELRRPPPPKVEPPKRVKIPPMPPVTLVPEAGSWLWTCRAGFEAQLYEELAWGKKSPFLLGPALISSEPFTGENPLPQPPTFARMGFLISDVVRSPADAAAALPDEPTKVQVWVPDTDVANARAGEAAAWADTIAAIRSEEGLVDPETPWKASEQGAWLGQVCLIGPGVGVVGRVRAREALSLSAGGRARMKRSSQAPSRAAMKLDEASISAARPEAGPARWPSAAPGCGASTPPTSPPTCSSSRR
jgi:23S rRNA (cytidine2498-2'-O)-methyltransferase